MEWLLLTFQVVALAGDTMVVPAVIPAPLITCPIAMMPDVVDCTVITVPENVAWKTDGPKVIMLPDTK